MQHINQKPGSLMAVFCLGVECFTIRVCNSHTRTQTHTHARTDTHKHLRMYPSEDTLEHINKYQWAAGWTNEERDGWAERHASRQAERERERESV